MYIFLIFNNLLYPNDFGQVTYTVGRDPQYTRSIVAEAPPLITTPVIVSNYSLSIEQLIFGYMESVCKFFPFCLYL